MTISLHHSMAFSKRFEKALTYLHNQHEWIGNYEQWQQQGYPVGSGLIELY